MTSFFEKHGILVIFYILALLDVCLGMPLILRIGLLILLVILATLDDFVYALPVVLLINDYLGTAFGSSLSFYWIAGALVAFRMCYKKYFTISLETAIFLAIGCSYCYFLYIVQYDFSYRTPLQILIYFIITADIIETAINDAITLNKIFLAFGCAVVIAAVQMAFFGGIDYTAFGYEGTNGTWERTMRYGLMGVGNGDPNFSGLRLIFGWVCIIFSDIRKPLKIIISALFFYCIIKTVSLTAFVVLGLITALIALTQNGLDRKIKMIGGALFAVITIIFMATVFPLGVISDQISLFQYRAQIVLSALLNGEYSTVTTGRTSAALENLNYAFSRNILKVLFGFDSIPAPGAGYAHNTYVDMVVRYGVLGFVIIIAAILKRFVDALSNHIENHNNESQFIIILKSLFIVYCLTLSIYQGADIVLLIWFALIL